MTRQSAGHRPPSEAPPMLYTEIPCRPELAPWVAAHWHFRVAPGAGEIEHHIPLTGGPIVSVGGGAPMIISGPRVTPLVTTVRGGDVFWGTHLWPGTPTALFGDAEGLREASLPAFVVLPPVFGSRGTEWAQEVAEELAPLASVDADLSNGNATESRAAAILDRAWIELVHQAAPLDTSVMDGVFRILASDGESAISRIADAVGLSPRQFRRRFRAASGLTPKELARVQRARAAAVSLVTGSGDPVDTARPTWVELAVRHGYSDQAHLVREYRALFGLTPQGFDRHVGRIQHGRLLR